MYDIIFYDDERGHEPVKEYIEQLREKSLTDKDARINLRKIVAYLDALGAYGTRIGAPVTKYLAGEIWELRPLANRILYAYFKDNKFILLHHFIKKSQKTPRKEIEQAKRNLESYIERYGD